MRPRKDLTSSTLFGLGLSVKAVILAGSVLIPFSSTVCPRKVTDFRNKSHFSGFSNSPASLNLVHTKVSRRTVSSAVGPTTTMSSMYTAHSFQFNPLRTVSIALSKVAGALQSPNGIVLNSYSPSLVEKAVFGLSSSSIGICQNPLAKSIVHKYLQPFRLPSVSCMWGSG